MEFHNRCRTICSKPRWMQICKFLILPNSALTAISKVYRVDLMFLVHLVHPHAGTHSPGHPYHNLVAYMPPGKTHKVAAFTCILHSVSCYLGSQGEEPCTETLLCCARCEGD